MSEFFDRLEVMRANAHPLPWEVAHYYDVGDDDFRFLFAVMTEYTRIRDETAGLEKRIAQLESELAEALADVGLRQVRKARLAEALAASVAPLPTGFLPPSLAHGVYDTQALENWKKAD